MKMNLLLKREPSVNKQTNGVYTSSDGHYEVYFLGHYIGTTRTKIEAYSLLKRLKDVGPRALDNLQAVFNSIRIAA